MRAGGTCICFQKFSNQILSIFMRILQFSAYSNSFIRFKSELTFSKYNSNVQKFFYYLKQHNRLEHFSNTFSTTYIVSLIVIVVFATLMKVDEIMKYCNNISIKYADICSSFAFSICMKDYFLEYRIKKQFQEATSSKTILKILHISQFRINRKLPCNE